MNPSELTRKNNTLWSENTRMQGGIKIYRAIVWGTRKQVSFKELLEVWYSEKRAIDASIMLANVICESNRMPYIARYEIGQHFDNPFYEGGKYYQKSEFEYEATSFGLFQPMGYHILNGKYATKSENAFKDFTIDKQFDCFVDLMTSWCLPASRRIFKTTEEIVYGAIAGYAGNPRMRNWIIDKKFNAWKMLEKKDERFLIFSGFNEEEIEFFKEKDNF